MYLRSVIERYFGRNVLVNVFWVKGFLDNSSTCVRLTKVSVWDVDNDVMAIIVIHVCVNNVELVLQIEFVFIALMEMDSQSLVASVKAQDIYELLRKLIEDLHIISEELEEYINSPSWNRPVFYDDEEHSIQYNEHLENSSNAIAPVLPTEEPDNSLSMRDGHLSTIPETELDEVIKSSIENLIPVPSESEVTSDNESDDDESLSNEDVPMENFKIYSNPLVDDKESISHKIDPYYFNAKSNLLESLLDRDTLIDSSPKFDYFLEEFSGELTQIDPIPPKIKEADFDLEKEIRLVENLFDSQMEEIDLFLYMNDLMPPGIESGDYDSKGDIHFLEELLCNDTLPLPENKSSNFDHHDDPSFPRPPPEPPDVEIFFDFEPDTGVLIVTVVEDISEHHVFMPKVLPSQPTLCPNIDTLLLFSSENKDKVFKHGILSYLLVSHRAKAISDFSESPMMMYGGDVPLLNVLFLHFYPP
uniref:Reverse transcriptase domain-containing protein n=1 Tax=Tanacetum cinerariifolium TaxID=118510 RepID=A0A6L2MTA3_TANCI|nr:hypothetical protein [Tanacetum cinerariifolium]